eukprot:TRINITY_DN23798_c0_g1_i1.p1 TRINITY_DN23798_c0_g1~~TRINITY_DN23798_c0_g1_i1.p1  ORF type:complete len:368 (-),score=113.24 TRINITY_DN23798_c0_g1_i1:153-1256(-)
MCIRDRTMGLLQRARAEEQGHLQGVQSELQAVRCDVTERFNRDIMQWQEAHSQVKSELAAVCSERDLLKADLARSKKAEQAAKDGEATTLSQLAAVQTSMHDRTETEMKESLKREAARCQQMETSALDWQRKLHEAEHNWNSQVVDIQKRLDQTLAESNAFKESNKSLNSELVSVKQHFESAVRALQQLQQCTMELGNESSAHQLELGHARRELAQVRHEHQLEISRSKQAEASSTQQIRRLESDLDQANRARGTNPFEAQQLQAQMSMVREDLHRLADGQMHQAVADARAESIKGELDNFLRDLRLLEGSEEFGKIVLAGESLSGSLRDMLLARGAGARSAGSTSIAPSATTYICLLYTSPSPRDS